MQFPLSYPCLFIISFLLPLHSSAQGKTTDYYPEMARYDLSSLWHAAKLYNPEGDAGYQWDDFPEPLGFIGSNYQRFYIHYISIVRDAKNPYRYLVQGKTRVRNNICHFTGTITVTQARLFNDTYQGTLIYHHGYLVCQVDLQEDRVQKGSGIIKGRMTTDWYLNRQNKPAYYNLEASDGFSNNQCVATWTSYAGGPAKPCHWGDFRIPESGSLDTGAGEMYVNNKYLNNGWQTFTKAKLAEQGNAAGKKAQAEEKRPWWK